MKFNIENLEKLACLKLDEKQKQNLSNSLQDIIGMLKSVEQENITIDLIRANKPTTYREENFISPSKEGLNITEEGYFLAPKTIKKG